MMLDIEDDDVILMAPISGNVRIGKKDSPTLKYILSYNRELNRYTIHHGDEQFKPVIFWISIGAQTQLTKERLALHIVTNGIDLVECRE